MVLIHAMTLNRFPIVFALAAALAVIGGPGVAAAAPAPVLAPHERPVYEAAVTAAQNGQFQDAAALAGQTQDPLLIKLVQWLELIEPRRVGDFATVARFIAENPDWPSQERLRLRAERDLPLGLPDADVIAWFKEQPPLTAEGAIRYAEALIARGDRSAAIALLRRTWIERGFGPDLEATFLARHGAHIGPDDHRARLDRLLWDRESVAATRQAARLGSGYAALAQARLKLAQRQSGVDAAIDRIPPSLRDDPGLVYERARWRQRKGAYDGVIELLDPPRPDAPNAERWWSLRRWTVRQALVAGDISAAYRIASEHGQTAGLGFAEAEWLAGWIALRFLDEPDAAYAHFLRLNKGVSSPISLARSEYWAGEAAQRLDLRKPGGQWRATAKVWYGHAAQRVTSFYGQLAARRLGQLPNIEWIETAPPSAAARTAFTQNELVRMTRLLGTLGEETLQRRFLGRLEALAESADHYSLLADLASEQNRPDLALRAARAARREGILISADLFPATALDTRDGIEEALLLALVRQESGFYTDAVSHAGARGLMQLMPGTAKQVARQVNVGYSQDRLTSDPRYNLLLGQSYLGDLLDRFDGSYILALAGYNAGPNRAARWIGDYGDPRNPDIDPVDWIESIPFEETRNYVQRILEALVIYRQKLGRRASVPAVSLHGDLATSWRRPVP